VVVPPDKAPGAAMRDVDLNLTDIVSMREREHGSLSDVITRAEIRMRYSLVQNYCPPLSILWYHCCYKPFSGTDAVKNIGRSTVQNVSAVLHPAV